MMKAKRKTQNAKVRFKSQHFDFDLVVLNFALKFCLLPFAFCFFPMRPMPWAHAEAAKSPNTTLETSTTNQGGTDSSAGLKSMDQVSLGDPFVGVLSLSGGYAMVTGFAETTSEAGIFPPLPVPVDLLSIPRLVAKVSPLGAEIPPSVWQRVSNPYFQWDPPESQDRVAGYSFAIDAQPDVFVDTTNASYQVPDRLLVDGQHTFTVEAITTTGTAGPPTALALWIDRTPPTVRDVAPAAGSLLNRSTPTLSAHVTDAGTGSGVASDGLVLQVNGRAVPATYDAATGVVTFTPASPLGDGPITASLDAADAAGNHATLLVWSFTLDTQAPAGTVAINAGDRTTSTVYVNLTVDAQDTLSGVDQMELSNTPAFTGQWQSFTSFVSGWMLTPASGTQRVYVRFKDRAGNISSATAAAIELIITAPDTLILNGPSGVTAERDAHFTFAASAPGTVFSIQMDTGEWTAWAPATEFITTGLAPGNHYFKVKAGKDANGNGQIDPDEEDPTPSERTWTISASTEGPVTPKERPVKFWRVE